MPILFGLIGIALGWALWTKRLLPSQLLPTLLIIAGAGIAAKGQFLGGIAVLVIGIAWFAGKRKPVSQNQSHAYQLDQARNLLGITGDYDANMVRACHRKLITENHPDTGGSDERAALLNKARDLLLAEMKNKQS
ncbi:MAG: molecular chaperone DnaJ [Sphingomonadales bacterium]|nr:molecular chaperone DnaJ [Sphingomonadales bacterium]